MRIVRENHSNHIEESFHTDMKRDSASKSLECHFALQHHNVVEQNFSKCVCARVHMGAPAACLHAQVEGLAKSSGRRID